MSNGMATDLVRPRWIARLAAGAGGYFWLPCPICGECFAGFEWGESLMRSWTESTGTCARPECRVETRRRNREWMALNTLPKDQEWLRQAKMQENEEAHP